MSPSFRSRLPLLAASLALLLITGACARRPPILNCVVDQSTVIEGARISIETNSTDFDIDALTFNWTATSGIRPPEVVFGTRNVNAGGSTAVYDSTGIRAGRYTIRVDASGDGRQANCSVNVTVEKNKQAPTVVCGPNDVRVTEGQSTTLSVQASDPNGDPITYAWTLDGQSVPNDRSSFEFGSVGRDLGAHAVGVTVMDSDDMSASCRYSVNIDRRPNEDPTVGLRLDKTDVYAGDTVTASAETNDPDGDPTTLSWSVDGRSRSGASSRLVINTGGFAGGRHTVSVTVQDDRDGRGTNTLAFSVVEKSIIQVNAIRPDNLAKARLDEIALKMRQNSSLRATLTGHTDSTGSDEANQRMGQRRADAVKAYLVEEQQVNESRIETRSAGSSRPVADNGTQRGCGDNRRVEIELHEGALRIELSALEVLPSRRQIPAGHWQAHLDWAKKQLAACRDSSSSGEETPCHTFLGQALEKAYSIADFKIGRGYLRPHDIANYVAEHEQEWVSMGSAGDQEVLQTAQRSANKGVAVLAVSSGHAALILPGQLSHSSSWGLDVPNSTTFFPRSGSRSYLGRELSYAWKNTESAGVQLYYRVAGNTQGSPADD